MRWMPFASIVYGGLQFAAGAALAFGVALAGAWYGGRRAAGCGAGLGADGSGCALAEAAGAALADGA